MNVLAVDPGSSESAWVLMRDGVPVEWAKEPNEVVLRKLDLRIYGDGDGFNGSEPWKLPTETVIAIEWIESYGMGFAKDIANTIRWCGRFEQKWVQNRERFTTNGTFPLVYVSRKDVKLTLCGTLRGVNDAVIRQRVIDHYGGEAAIGGVRCQRCKGKGWRGRERTPCADCHDEDQVFDGLKWVTKGSGWRVPPGPLHGMAGDCWQALAVALTWLERNGNHD
jgi:hypothetical protein